jgi:hypothetical protein
MKNFRFAFWVVLASVCALLVMDTASAASSSVVGHLYVNDNTGGVNTIGALTATPMAR